MSFVKNIHALRGLSSSAGSSGVMARAVQALVATALVLFSLLAGSVSALAQPSILTTVEFDPSTIQANAGGSYTITYIMNMINTGDEDLEITDFSSNFVTLQTGSNCPPSGSGGACSAPTNIVPGSPPVTILPGSGDCAAGSSAGSSFTANPNYNSDTDDVLISNIGQTLPQGRCVAAEIILTFETSEQNFYIGGAAAGRGENSNTVVNHITEESGGTFSGGGGGEQVTLTKSRISTEFVNGNWRSEYRVSVENNGTFIGELDLIDTFSPPAGSSFISGGILSVSNSNFTQSGAFSGFSGNRLVELSPGDTSDNFLDTLDTLDVRYFYEFSADTGDTYRNDVTLDSPDIATPLTASVTHTVPEISVSVAKEFGDHTDLPGDENFRITFTTGVHNTTGATLYNLELNDDFVGSNGGQVQVLDANVSTTIPASCAGLFPTASGISAASANPAYTADSTDPNLQNQNDPGDGSLISLAPDACIIFTKTIDYHVTNGSALSVVNQPGRRISNDLSFSGTLAPDPSSQTITGYALAYTVGRYSVQSTPTDTISKQLINSDYQGDDIYVHRYRITIDNVGGATTLDSVSDTFNRMSGASRFEVVSVSHPVLANMAGTYTLSNPVDLLENFNGATINLNADTTYSFDVDVTFTAEPGGTVTNFVSASLGGGGALNSSSSTSVEPPFTPIPGDKEFIDFQRRGNDQFTATMRMVVTNTSNQTIYNAELHDDFVASSFGGIGNFSNISVVQGGCTGTNYAVPVGSTTLQDPNHLVATDDGNGIPAGGCFGVDVTLDFDIVDPSQLRDTSFGKIIENNFTFQATGDPDPNSTTLFTADGYAFERRDAPEQSAEIQKDLSFVRGAGVDKYVARFEVRVTNTNLADLSNYSLIENFTHDPSITPTSVVVTGRDRDRATFGSLEGTYPATFPLNLNTSGSTLQPGGFYILYVDVFFDAPVGASFTNTATVGYQGGSDSASASGVVTAYEFNSDKRVNDITSHGVNGNGNEEYTIEYSVTVTNDTLTDWFNLRIFDDFITQNPGTAFVSASLLENQICSSFSLGFTDPSDTSVPQGVNANYNATSDDQMNQTGPLAKQRCYRINASLRFEITDPDQIRRDGSGQMFFVNQFRFAASWSETDVSQFFEEDSVKITFSLDGTVPFVPEFIKTLESTSPDPLREGVGGQAVYRLDIISPADSTQDVIQHKIRDVFPNSEFTFGSVLSGSAPGTTGTAESDGASFTGFTILSGGQTTSIRYSVNVGSGIESGLHTNTATLLTPADDVVARDTEDVPVTGDPIVEKTFRNGKEFDPLNHPDVFQTYFDVVVENNTADTLTNLTVTDNISALFAGLSPAPSIATDAPAATFVEIFQAENTAFVGVAANPNWDGGVTDSDLIDMSVAASGRALPPFSKLPLRVYIGYRLNGYDGQLSNEVVVNTDGSPEIRDTEPFSPPEPPVFDKNIIDPATGNAFTGDPERSFAGGGSVNNVVYEIRITPSEGAAEVTDYIVRDNLPGDPSQVVFFPTSVRTNGVVTNPDTDPDITYTESPDRLLEFRNITIPSWEEFQQTGEAISLQYTLGSQPSNPEGLYTNRAVLNNSVRDVVGPVERTFEVTPPENPTLEKFILDDNGNFVSDPSLSSGAGGTITYLVRVTPFPGAPIIRSVTIEDTLPVDSNITLDTDSLLINGSPTAVESSGFSQAIYSAPVLRISQVDVPAGNPTPGGGGAIPTLDIQYTLNVAPGAADGPYDNSVELRKGQLNLGPETERFWVGDPILVTPTLEKVILDGAGNPITPANPGDPSLTFNAGDGGVVTYQITVTPGPGGVQTGGFSVVDTLPVGSGVTLDTSGGSMTIDGTPTDTSDPDVVFSNPDLTFNNLTVPADGDGTIVLTYRLNIDTSVPAGSYPNSAVLNDDDGLVDGPEVKIFTVEGGETPTVELVKTADSVVLTTGADAQPGRFTATFTLTANNTSTSAAVTDVQITDDVQTYFDSLAGAPANLANPPSVFSASVGAITEPANGVAGAFVAASTTPWDATAAAPGIFEADPSTAADRTIPAGESLSVVVSVTFDVNDYTDANGDLQNTATVDTEETDPVETTVPYSPPSNEASVELVKTADSVVLTTGADAQPGRFTATFTLTANNTSTSAAVTDVQITDDVQAYFDSLNGNPHLLVTPPSVFSASVGAITEPANGVAGAFVAASTTPWDATAAAPGIFEADPSTAADRTIPAGESLSVVVSVTFDVNDYTDANGDLQNTATVDTEETDPVETTVPYSPPSSDPTIEKHILDASGDPIDPADATAGPSVTLTQGAGGSVTYQIVVTPGAGSVALPGYSVVDSLPTATAGLSLDTSAGSMSIDGTPTDPGANTDISFDAGTNVLSFLNQTVPADGSTLVITYRVLVDGATAVGTYDNSVVLNDENGDPVDGPETETFEVEPAPSLAPAFNKQIIDQSGNPIVASPAHTFLSGTVNTVRYRITIAPAAGSGELTGYIVRDNLPTGTGVSLDNTSVTRDGLGANPDTDPEVTFTSGSGLLEFTNLTIPSAADGGSVILEYELNTDANSVAGTYPNSAVLNDGTNNVAGPVVRIFEIEDAPRPSMVKSITAPTSKQLIEGFGGTVSYSIVITPGAGGVELPDYSVTDVLPVAPAKPGVTLDTGSITVAGFSQAVGGGVVSYNAGMGTLIFDPLTIPAEGSTLTLTYDLIVDSTALNANNPYTNAAVLRDENDDDVDTGQDTFNLTPAPAAPVLTKTRVDSTVFETNAGGTATFRLRITPSAGSPELPGWSVRDTLPTGMTLIGAPTFAPDNGTNNATGTNPVTFNDLTIPAGGSGNLIIEYQVDVPSTQAAGTYQNSAQLRDDTNQNVGNPQRATVEVIAVASPEDIILEKFATAPELNDDENTEVTFTVRVTNTNTEAPFSGFEVVDDLQAAFPSPMTILDVRNLDISNSSNGAGNCRFNTSGFGASNSTLISSPGADLVPGGICEISFLVEFDPDTFVGDIVNIARTPNNSHEASASIAVGTFFPQLRINKENVTTTLQLDGTYSTRLRVRVTNSGNKDVTGVAIVDDLAQMISGDAVIASGAPTVTATGGDSTSCSANGSYTGFGAQTSLISSPATISKLGGFCELEFTLTITPNSFEGTMLNIATTADDSGLSDENGANINIFPSPPSLELQKTVSTVKRNSDETYTVLFQIDVANTGGKVLSNVTLTDNLNTTFATASSWTRHNTSLLDDFASADASGWMSDQNGSNATIFSGVTLPVDGEGTILYSVTYTPTDTSLTLTNTVAATGIDSAGKGVTASSDVEFQMQEGTPNILLDKELVDVEVVSQGTFRATFTLQVTNIGDRPLVSISVTDDQNDPQAIWTGLNGNLRFVAGSIATQATNAPGVVDTNNATYDPVSTPLVADLTGGEQLDPGDTATLALTLEFDVDSAAFNNGEFRNVARVVAEDASGTEVSSTDAVLIRAEDLIGDAGGPRLDMVKKAGRVIQVDASATTFDAPFTLTISNHTSEDAYNLVVTDVVDDVCAQGGWTGCSVVRNSATNVTNAANAPTATTAPFSGSTSFLSGDFDLGAGETIVISFDMRFNSNGDQGPYTNVARVAGEDALGNPLVAQDQDDTEVRLDNADIEIDKEYVSTEPVRDGSGNDVQNQFRSVFYLQVINGSEDMVDVVVTDDLVGGWTAAGTSAQVVDISILSSRIVDPSATPSTSPSSTTYMDPNSVWTLGSTPVANATGAVIATADQIPGDILPANATTTFRIVVEYTVPNANAADSNFPLFNTAYVDGIDPSGVAQYSADTVEVTKDEVIGDTGHPNLIIEKDADRPIEIDGQVGRYRQTYSLEIANTGPETLHNVFVNDDIVSHLGAGDWDSFSVISLESAQSLTVLGTPFTPDAAAGNWYTTDTDYPPHYKDTLTFTLEFDANGDLGPWENIVDASGQNSLGEVQNRQSSEDVTILDSGRIGIAKNTVQAATDATTAPQGGLPASTYQGDFDVTFDYLVRNYSEDDFRNVQVIDDLKLTFFDTAEIIQVATPVVTGGSQSDGANPYAGPSSFTVNSSYDGITDVNLLAGTDRLLYNEEFTVTLTVRFRPNREGPDFLNEAIVTATNSENQEVGDESHNGTNPDTSGDGVPDEEDPTPFVVPEAPAIAITKSMVFADQIIEDPINPGAYLVEFDLWVENIGNVDLFNVSVTDDLFAAFADDDAAGESAFVEVVEGPNVTGTFVSAGTNFDGNINNNGTGTELLSPTSWLPTMTKEHISFTIRIDPTGALQGYDNYNYGNDNDGSFQNFAAAAGTSAGGVPATDTASDDDPTGDPRGNQGDTPTEIPMPADPHIGLAKFVSSDPVEVTASDAGGAIGGNASGTTDQSDIYDIEFTFVVQNTGNTPLTNISLTDNFEETADGFRGGADQSGSRDPELIEWEILSVTGPIGGASVTGIQTSTGTQELLDRTGDMLPGEEGTVVVRMRWDTDQYAGVYENTADTEGTPPAGTDNDGDPSNGVTTAPVTDTSRDGTDPDPRTSSDDPRDNRGADTQTLPTPFVVPSDSVIGLAKHLTQVQEVVNGGIRSGEFVASYEFRLVNGGNKDLRNIVVEDDLLEAFRAPAVVTAVSDPVISGATLSTTAASLTANTGALILQHNGTGLGAIITDGTLPVGESIIFTMDITFDPNGKPSSWFFNSAEVEGVDSDNNPVSDISEDQKNVLDHFDPATGAFIDNQTGTCNVTTTEPFETDPDNGTNGIGPDAENDHVDGADFGTDDRDHSMHPSNESIPGNNSNPTPLCIPEVTGIGLSKKVELNAEGLFMTEDPDEQGTFHVTFRLAVENRSNVDLTAVQVTDILDDPAGDAFRQHYRGVVTAPIATGTLKANPHFTGEMNGDFNLLDASESMLPVGQTEFITFTVKFTPDNDTNYLHADETALSTDDWYGPYYNTADTEGTSPEGVTVTDTSHEDNDLTPSDDGALDFDTVENDQNEPTEIPFHPVPKIGVAKRVSKEPVPVAGTPTQFDIEFEMRVQNVGNTVLRNIQVTDNFRSVFAGATATPLPDTENPQLVEVRDVYADPILGGISPNVSADAPLQDNVNLLTGLGKLNPGEEGFITVSVRWDADNFHGVYNNQVEACGTGPESFQLEATPYTYNTGDPFSWVTTDNGGDPDGTLGRVCDVSTDGTDTDTDTGGLDPYENPNPEDDFIPTPFTVPSNAEVGIAKELVSVTTVTDLNGTYTGQFDATYRLRIVNAGNYDLYQVVITDDLRAAFPAPATVDGIAMLPQFATYGGTVAPVDGDTGNPLTSVQFTPNISTGADSFLNTDVVGTGTLLPVDGVFELEFTVRFDPNGLTSDHFRNRARIDAMDETNQPVFDWSEDRLQTLSDNGDGTIGIVNEEDFETDPDLPGLSPDEEKTPGNNNLPTPLLLPELPQIGLAKRLDRIIDDVDFPGMYRAYFTLAVENLGNVDLKNIQVTDAMLNSTDSPTAPSITGAFPDIFVQVIETPVVNTPLATAGALYTGNPGGGVTVVDLRGINLLDAADSTLQVGELATITFAVLLDPRAVTPNNYGPFENTATATAEGPHGTPTSDVSDDDQNLDPNEPNGDPNDPAEADPDPAINESDPTDIVIPQGARIALAKTAGPVERTETAGQYEVTYSLRVQNVGDVPLDNVQITDDLRETFDNASDATFMYVVADSVTGLPVVHDNGVDLHVNTSFAGYEDLTGGDISLLMGDARLDVGEEAQFSFRIRFQAVGSDTGPFDNSATTTGDPSSGAPQVSDVSQDSGDLDPDPDTASNLPGQNGGAGNHSDPTPVYAMPDGLLGLAKDLVAITDAATTPLGGQPAGLIGQYDVHYKFYVQNYGPTTLFDVQVEDDLRDTFGPNVDIINVTTVIAGSAFTSPSTLQSGINLNFDGEVDTYLLFGSLDLPPASTLPTVQNPTPHIGELEFVVRIDPNEEPGPFFNTATATAIHPQVGELIDVSQNGTDPDPANPNPADPTNPNNTPNGDPRDNDEPTPASLPIAPSIGVAKEMTLLGDGPTDNGPWTVRVDYVIRNYGNVALTNLTMPEDLELVFGTVVTDWRDLTYGQISETDELGVPVAISSVKENPAYTGWADAAGNGSIEMLDQGIGLDGSFLDPGHEVTFAIELVLNNLTDTSSDDGTRGDYFNQVIVTGTLPNGTDTISDTSHSGADPVDPADPDADPANANDPSPLVIGNINVAKSITRAERIANQTTFEIDHLLIIENTGGSRLENLQIIEDLEAWYGTAFVQVLDHDTDGDIMDITEAAGNTGGNTLPLAGSWDGSSANSAMFDTSVPSLLLQGERYEVRFTVEVNPEAANAPEDLENQVLASGDGIEDGLSHDDLSDSGTDPNGTNDDDDPDTPTPIFAPSINISKRVTAVEVLETHGHFILTFEVHVVNNGNKVLNDMHLWDNVHEQFRVPGSGGDSAFVAVIQQPVIRSSDFTGTTDIQPNPIWMSDLTTLDPGTGRVQHSDLLAPAHSGILEPDDSFIMDYRVHVNRDASGAPVAPDKLENQVYGTGVAPDGTLVDDLSDDGVNPEGNNTYGGPDDPTPLPIYPVGVVYDSVTRIPVAGAAVTIVNATQGGVPVPASCLMTAASNPQFTDAQGGYYIELTHDDPLCPEGEQYGLLINGIAQGYRPVAWDQTTGIPAGAPWHAVLGNVNAPEMNGGSVAAYVNELCAGGDVLPGEIGCHIQVQPTAPGLGADPADPSDDQDSTYYLLFELTDHPDDRVYHFHVPLDRVPQGQHVIDLTKTAGVPSARVGDFVPWTISGDSTVDAQLDDTDIVDRLPPGFSYLPGSGYVIIRDQAGTVTWEGPVEPIKEGLNLTFRDMNMDIPVFGSIEVKLTTVVGTGVREGFHTNHGQAFNPLGEELSRDVTAQIETTPEPVFDCSDIIGKVFNDKNANGYQDKGEPGLPAVRVVTPRGLSVKTDRHGRFHVSCAMIANADRGSNFLMKVDVRTLPAGFRITTENPRVVRLTRGKTTRLNFGASIHRVVRLDLSDDAFISGTLKVDDQWRGGMGIVLQRASEMPSVLRVTYRTRLGRDLALRRVNTVADFLEQQLKKMRADVIVEKEIIRVFGETTTGRTTTGAYQGPRPTVPATGLATTPSVTQRLQRQLEVIAPRVLQPQTQIPGDTGMEIVPPAQYPAGVVVPRDYQLLKGPNRIEGSAKRFQYFLRYRDGRIFDIR